MSYRENSSWNENNEILCLIIFKRLQEANFPRGKQMEYCREMSHVTNLDAGNISAKVSNYKSVAGINNASNASVNTVRLFKQYGHLTIQELKRIIKQ